MVKMVQVLIPATVVVLSALLSLAAGDLLDESDFLTVFPERFDAERWRRDVSTRTKDGHIDGATVQIKSRDNHFILDIKRNVGLLHPSFVVRSFNKDNKEIIHQDQPERCHYQGVVRGFPDSDVVLHTCNGLKGIIYDGKSTYVIEPDVENKEIGAHKFYLARDNTFDEHKSGSWNNFLFHDSDDQDSKLFKRFQFHPKIATVDEVYREYLTTDETRYNEAIFAVDYEVYLKFNKDIKLITDHIITLVNAVDRSYQHINIRIVIKALEIWSNGDPIPNKHDEGAGPDLGVFTNYRKEVLMKRFGQHDNSIMVRSYGWPNGVAGMAHTAGMCKERSASIIRWLYNSLLGPYVGLGHEMGHNFGFPHDSSGNCKCLTRRGCFMGGHKTWIPGFSNCSLLGLQKIDDKCLYNVPTESLNSWCGNGIREGGEECDCGSPEMCKEKDPCCEPENCVLKPGAQCSDLHHFCCESCLYKRHGTLCREVKTDCDVPEYCSGDSRDCPKDSYIQDGYPCNRTNKLFQGNTDGESIVINDLHPRIEARFVRISPQFYNGWMCLRAELYGCSADQVSPISPTPLKSYNDFCVQPQDTSCQLKDNSKLVFTYGGVCSHDFMEFSLDANGILRHHCSGKMVCPENGKTTNFARLTISSSCKEEDSTFERTAANSLKHVKSGKCVQSTSGKPGIGRELQIKSACDNFYSEIWFMKQDCVFPLGVGSGKIPDSQITGSSHKNSDPPHYGRLNNNGKWCAKRDGKSEYLEIDLGKVQSIQRIATQGKYKQWVTGFHLYYSEDGQRWVGVSESGFNEHSNANCYLGECSETHATQCQDLWGPTADNGASACYNTMNRNDQGYGTCTPGIYEPCSKEDILCGQLQCLDQKTKPLVDFGKKYDRITLESGEQCSVATLKIEDVLGEGMVNGGTKCGDNKMCKDYKCQSLTDLGITKCPEVDGKECAGRGVCTNDKKCHCDVGYDPDTACESVLTPLSGRWSEWSTWSVCTKGCNEGTRRRHRFCNNPVPRYGGAECEGDREQEERCNTDPCPIGISCRHIQQMALSNNKVLPDDVYTIKAGEDNLMPVYCDMSRDGGGWTLLVTSHYNRWTTEDILLKNKESPRLDMDYSMLSHADSIKNNLNVKGENLEYRLEAETRGHWGGIWKAPRTYSFVSDDNKQTAVKLTKKFDDWDIGGRSIENRMPWVAKNRLTTSQDAYVDWWGTIAANDREYYAAPWITGRLMPEQPVFIWYWMREGPYEPPRSCMEVQFRGLLSQPQKNGIYAIKPPGQKEVKTYCDMTTYGGGWTLVSTSKTHSGWTKENVLERNTDNPSLDGDFSILGSADAIKDADKSQEFFQFRIEADGQQSWGGIWQAPRDYSFRSTTDEQTGITLVEKFDNWDEQNNLASCMPRLALSSDVFLTSASSSSDLAGSIVYNSGANQATFMKEKPNPGVVRYWMREGSWRSCNEIKLRGVRVGNKYEDGFFMIRTDKSQYLPVYCDMTTADGGFTLLVTSAHNGWTVDQVLSRNRLQPTLYADYSILELGDSIKSLSNGDTFQYMLDAKQRRHWGGVFEAPISFSFVATNNRQKGVRLIEKFNDWDFSWKNSIDDRMPWVVAEGSKNQALLTTSASPTFNSYGSVLWEGKDRYPAQWILKGGMRDPGVIWYWVNEDDCDSDRQPVNGGMTAWSSWGPCNKLCESGKEKRQRTCTQPKPRCAGKQCDPTMKTVEERECNFCPESPIRSTLGFCVQPKNAGCSAAELEGSYLIFKDGNENCSEQEAMFVFDQDGVIHHKCSKMIVCPEGGRANSNSKLVLKKQCDLNAAKHIRLPNKRLQNAITGQCVRPDGRKPEDGQPLVYRGSCADRQEFELEFITLGVTEVQT